MWYLVNQMLQDTEILLDCVRQDSLKDKLVFKNQTMKCTYIYYMTRWNCLVHFSNGLIFKTVFNGKSDAFYFKFDNEYYADPILRQQHNTNKQIR